MYGCRAQREYAGPRQIIVPVAVDQDVDLQLSDERSDRAIAARGHVVEAVESQLQPSPPRVVRWRPDVERNDLECGTVVALEKVRHQMRAGRVAERCGEIADPDSIAVVAFVAWQRCRASGMLVGGVRPSAALLLLGSRMDQQCNVGRGNAVAAVNAGE